ncbi:signal recognition particle protein [Clostridium tyrobutyricum]|uniref:Signal recognition particle protein n=1 Tax=Clostridium tyrobutyricum DIVETGP TaxID=1408889 RepID=W6N4T2_CLOTY|nr:signal recognition particle protein [Clostridium tyrobutyricum]AND85067.1 signal recognition particle protein [Clostridium tyrobutyricum]ANP69627.1 signal recognition particle protein [Clostridium tyrobutyricum]MBR9647037.1 signal recognition particle protein [Clostridium tyrobutyricum]MBV4426740.1 signal recognition particle protein [Clostridium tyrobutyricum]MBV4433018.1 signal recognition particle protein [Clostridium tyrobutyricum]
MAFEGLASKLQETLKKLRGKGKLSEKDIKDAMREVKLALLEADVNYKVVRDFIKSVSEKCFGEAVLKSLTPAQQVIKIVNEELTALMGKSESSIEYSKNGLTIIMLVGLQGAGKTTMCGKLALELRKKNKKPLLVACDIYRPAAIKQLQVVGKQIDIPVFSMGDRVTAADISKGAVEYAKNNNLNVVIIDTAGRLQIDEKLMNELKDVKQVVNPNEIMLVVDSMTGQDAVNVAKSFNEQIDITGVILTKLDGDTRGGAALSIRAMTGKPIKFIGLGEKMNDFQVFHPDRMASRILGMGDVLSLIEKAQQSIDQDEAKQLGERMLNKEFNFQDFLDVMQQAKKLGPISKLVEMIPGVDSKILKGVDLSQGEKDLKIKEAIIKSMTQKERLSPVIISSSSSRKKRIASGSGTTIQQVNRLLKDFDKTKKMMKQFNGIKNGKGFGKNLFGKMPF